MIRPDRRSSVPLLTILLGLLLGSFLVPPSPTLAAAGDVGIEGQSFAGAASGVTGEKPESKLWWNDGFWWASMFTPDASADGGDYHIYRLDPSTQAWVRTDTLLDVRPGSKADTLWDTGSNKLYVASHIFGHPTLAAPSYLYRYSYQASTDTYSLDAGFPAQINNTRSETLVIDKDSTGQLWATWMKGGNVQVSHTLCSPTCNDANWAIPFVPNVNGVNPDSTNAASSDISSVIAFGDGPGGKDKIGLMWSNQDHGAMYFAIRSDSSPDASWEASRTAIQGPGTTDDHINLKSLLTDGSGRVYAAVKTSHTAAAAPLIMLLVRDPSNGEWASHVHSSVQYDQTRPIVLIDETADVLHMFTTDTGGGSVHRKTTPLSNISFSDGKGTVVMHDADAQNIDNATSTKQNLNSTTGLVVLASNSTTNRYWHYVDLLGGTPPPPPANSAPSASADRYSTAHNTTLSVAAPGVLSNDSDADGDALTATKLSGPTNGSLTLNANGSFSYTPTAGFSGDDSFTYRASDGTDSSASASVTISVAAAGDGVTRTFAPSDDAFVRSNFASSNYGAEGTVRLYKKSPTETHSYLKFSVSGLSGSVSSATLRLYVTDPSPDGGTPFSVANSSWAEETLTWANRPVLGSALGSSVGAVSAGSWAEFDVTGLIRGDGTYALALTTTAADSTFFSSKEGSQPPQLVVVSGGTPPP